MFVIINIIQNFYWFHLNVVLYFQNVMRVNIGRSLSNKNPLRWARRNVVKGRNIANFSKNVFSFVIYTATLKKTYICIIWNIHTYMYRRYRSIRVRFCRGLLPPFNSNWIGALIHLPNVTSCIPNRKYLMSDFVKSNICLSSNCRCF